MKTNVGTSNTGATIHVVNSNIPGANTIRHKSKYYHKYLLRLLFKIEIPFSDAQAQLIQQQPQQQQVTPPPSAQSSMGKSE